MHIINNLHTRPHKCITDRKNFSSPENIETWAGMTIITLSGRISGVFSSLPLSCGERPSCRDRWCQLFVTSEWNEFSVIWIREQKYVQKLTLLAPLPDGVIDLIWVVRLCSFNTRYPKRYYIQRICKYKLLLDSWYRRSRFSSNRKRGWRKLHLWASSRCPAPLIGQTSVPFWSCGSLHDSGLIILERSIR